MEIDDDFLTGACRNKDRGADRLEEEEVRALLQFSINTLNISYHKYCLLTSCDH